MSSIHLSVADMASLTTKFTTCSKFDIKNGQESENRVNAPVVGHLSHLQTLQYHNFVFYDVFLVL